VLLHAKRDIEAKAEALQRTSQQLTEEWSQAEEERNKTSQEVCMLWHGACYGLGQVVAWSMLWAGACCGLGHVVGWACGAPGTIVDVMIVAQSTSFCCR
jgi:hypothetical protein